MKQEAETQRGQYSGPHTGMGAALNLEDDRGSSKAGAEHRKGMVTEEIKDLASDYMSDKKEKTNKVHTEVLYSFNQEMKKILTNREKNAGSVDKRENG